MFFNLLRKQLIRASGLSPISIWYPWKIKEDFFFFFYCSDDFTFYMCWMWSRGKGPLKSLGWKVSKQVCYKEKVPHSFSAKHTHIHWNANSKLVACEQKSRRHAQNICMRAHTHHCKDTYTEKLQRKFLQPDITLLSGWLRGREMQIKREQRKGREGWERRRGRSSGSMLLTEQSVD